VLVLPAEAAAADEPARLAHGDLDELPSHAGGLAVGDGDERVAVDGLDEAVAEGVERAAEGAHLVAAEDALLDGGVDGTVVDERAAGVVDEVDAVEMAGPQLRDLADGSRDGALVALGAALGVEDGAQALVDDFALFEGVAIGVELRLRGEAVTEVVEARGGFGRRLGEDGRQDEAGDGNSQEGQP
jgi:hypothetical protein